MKKNISRDNLKKLVNFSQLFISFLCSFLTIYFQCIRKDPSIWIFFVFAGITFLAICFPYIIIVVEKIKRKHYSDNILFDEEEVLRRYEKIYFGTIKMYEDWLRIRELEDNYLTKNLQIEALKSKIKYYKVLLDEIKSSVSSIDYIHEANERELLSETLGKLEEEILDKDNKSLKTD